MLTPTGWKVSTFCFFHARATRSSGQAGRLPYFGGAAAPPYRSKTQRRISTFSAFRLFQKTASKPELGRLMIPMAFWPAPTLSDAGRLCYLWLEVRSCIQRMSALSPGVVG